SLRLANPYLNCRPARISAILSHRSRRIWVRPSPNESNRLACESLAPSIRHAGRSKDDENGHYHKYVDETCDAKPDRLFAVFALEDFQFPFFLLKIKDHFHLGDLATALFAVYVFPKCIVFA